MFNLFHHNDSKSNPQHTVDRLSIVYLSIALITVVNIGCDITPPSDPVSMSDAVGVYEANHSEVESLELLPTYVWIRTFRYGEDSVVVDSGKWKLDTSSAGYYKVGFRNYSFRSSEWANTSSLWQGSRSRVNVPTAKGWHSAFVRKSGSHLFLAMDLDFNLRYNKSR